MSRPTLSEMKYKKYGGKGSGTKRPALREMNMKKGKGALKLSGQGALKLSGQGALSIAGGAIKMSGQSENFKKLSKAEQKRVLASVLKMLRRKKQMGGLKIGALDLSMLPDIGSAISGVLAPKSALGRLIRKELLKLIGIRGDGVGVCGGSVKRPTLSEKKSYRAGKKGGGKKTSNWIQHVKTVAKQKGISYKEALKVAKSSYRK